jgi:3-oxoacyl-[acyl-carrier protein] reductase
MARNQDALDAAVDSLLAAGAPDAIGPGDGYFEEMDDGQWDAAFGLGTMSGVRSIRAMLRAAAWARIVTLSAHSIQR